MKTIQLTQGQVALVDDEDYDWLNQWKWYALKDSHTWYAIRAIRNIGPGHRQKSLKMHRVILGITDPSIKGDHKDGNGLNNQRSNLRIANNAQNVRNSRLKPNQTGYRGVYLTKRKKNPYKSSIMVLGKYIQLGVFPNIIDAAKAYDNAARLYHGEFAKINIK